MIDFLVRKTRRGLTVSIDPAFANDMVLILDTLADLARSIRNKAEGPGI